MKILIRNPIQWLAAFASCFTMVFSPLAMGKEAEKLTKVNLEKYMVEFGLDKQMTLGEFWEKTKAYIPGSQYRDLELFVNQNRNMQMPEVVLDQSKSTDGNDVPVMRISSQGHTQTLQFFGESKKWARFNGVTLTAADLERIEDAFKRVEASDIHLKREADQFLKNQTLRTQKNSDQVLRDSYKKDFTRFEGFPRMTPQLWKSMSRVDRAAYIVKMRLLWSNARKVLDTAEPEVKSQQKKKESALENFYKVIFGQSVEAAPVLATAALIPSVSVPVQGTSVRTQENGITKVVAIPYTAKSCVVAGYIGAYVANVTNVNGSNRAGCSADVAIATYQSNPALQFVQAANDACKSANTADFVACNPIVYGYPGGKEACISKVSVEYQYATHFTNPAPNPKETCDGKSRLSSSEDIIKFDAKDYSAVQPRAKQIEAIEADQKREDYALTKNYLDGVLAKKGTGIDKLLQGNWNIDMDNELVRIQSQFEEEIQRAISTCEKSVVEGANERNQKLACDQLHRRWLFTERFIAKFRDKACIKPALYVGVYDQGQDSTAANAVDKTAQNKKTVTAEGTNLCGCPDGKKVNFGGTCAAPAVTATTPVCPPVPPVSPAPPSPAGTTDVTPAKPTETPAPSVCVPAAEAPTAAPACDKPQGISDFDYTACKCEGNKKLEQKRDGSYECEGKTNWLPWLLGGGALLLLFALFHRHKGKNPTPVVVPGQCPTGKSGTPPSCVCSNVCPAGSTLNPESCACSGVVVPPLCEPPKIGTPPSCSCPSAPAFCTLPQKIYDMSTCQCTDVPQPVVCPNGTTAPNGNLSLCPKCPSGIFVPAGGCPNEGGGGNNCPQGGCSGGLPGTGH